MGRLINTDDLLKQIGLEDTEENREKNVGEIFTLEDLDRIPTAFDQHEVCRKIYQEAVKSMDAKEKAEKYHSNSILRFCGEICAYQNAIRIVEKGGTQDETDD